MNRPVLLAQIFLGVFVLVAAAGVDVPSIIPAPQQTIAQEGYFRLGPETKILVSSDAKDTGKFLAARLRRGTGRQAKVHVTSDPTPASNTILLSTQGHGADWPAEGYELTVKTNAVVIRAATPTGLFYGVQTLLQLLPPAALGPRPAADTNWAVPCVQIKDWPRFAWRGFMLDVSRHFFSKAEVEQLLDAMALYKLNTFHFHLVDDQGWRIQIKKYPRLTATGAWRKGIDFGLDPKSSTAFRADGKYGGYYTQKDIRELVRYAAERHITIVPEIEMPGHSAGALASYPEYSCFGGPYSLDGDDAVFCPGNEKTFLFLENILTEVFKLFPGEFIHIGGDEVSTANWKKCPKCQARMKEQGLTNELQLEGYLIQRIEKFANAHGKRLVGWSEIRNAGLAKNAAVMDWAGGAAEAASAGHDVIMSPYWPVDFCYLNVYQSRDTAHEPASAGGFLPLRQVYAFEPVPRTLAPEFQSHILGGQGNLWTEVVPNLRTAEYMIFPRECALAEVLWSPKESRHWEDFLARVKFNEQRLDAMNLNYRRNPTMTGEAKQ